MLGHGLLIAVHWREKVVFLYKVISPKAPNPVLAHLQVKSNSYPVCLKLESKAYAIHCLLSEMRDGYCKE